MWAAREYERGTGLSRSCISSSSYRRLVRASQLRHLLLHWRQLVSTHRGNRGTRTCISGTSAALLAAPYELATCLLGLVLAACLLELATCLLPVSATSRICSALTACVARRRPLTAKQVDGGQQLHLQYGRGNRGTRTCMSGTSSARRRLVSTSDRAHSKLLH